MFKKSTAMNPLAVRPWGVLLGLALGASAMAARITDERVSTGDGPRPFLLAQPDQPLAGPRPLVLVLHGHGGSAAQALGQKLGASPLAVWLQIADREGVLVAALDGSKAGDGKAGWNDCRRDAPGNPPTDDVAFAAAVVQKLVGAGRVDPQKVYAMGMSNGAMMTYRLAQELNPPLAGFVAVSGLMASDSRCALPQSRPVPAMVIAGTEDPLVPYQGGQVSVGGARRGGVLGAEATLAALLRVNQNTAPGRRSVFGVAQQRDGSWVERLDFGAPNDPARVALLTVHGGGHIEPSISQRYRPFYERLVGRQNHDIESAEVAWQFFNGTGSAGIRGQAPAGRPVQ